MFKRQTADRSIHAKQGKTVMPAYLRARDAWRLFVILFGALAMVLALTTAATHQHKTSVDARECAICSDVIDKVVDLPLLPAVMHHTFLMPYRILVVQVNAANFCPPSLLPPSCGPPHVSA